MNKIFATAIFSSIIAVAAATAFADDEFPFKRQIEARQSVMKIYAFNLGLLGAMAKGEAPYDAKLAGDASHNLLSNANMRNSTMWPAGSDVDAAGLADVTAAKASIWSNFPEIGEKHQALTTAIEAMAAVAGDDLSAVRANMGAVGKACKACHEQFRTAHDHEDGHH